MSELVTTESQPTGGAEPTRPRRAWRLGWVGWTALVFVSACAVTALMVPFLPLADPASQNLVDGYAPPSAAHWLGTDELGRDLFSRLLWAVRTSLTAALIAVAVGASIGVPLGLLGGYVGGWLDAMLGRLADTLLTVPALILLLTVQSALRTDIEGQMVTLGVIFAPRLYRVVRAATLTLANQPFVIAGRMSGCSHARILWRYLLPGVRVQAAVQVSYLLGLALLLEAGISFLGVGVRPPDASLGTLLAGASTVLAIEPMVVLVPAAVLTALILSMNLLGDLTTRDPEVR